MGLGYEGCFIVILVLESLRKGDQEIMNARQPKIHSEFKVFLDYITRLLFKLSGTNQ